MDFLETSLLRALTRQGGGKFEILFSCTQFYHSKAQPSTTAHTHIHEEFASSLHVTYRYVKCHNLVFI